MYISLCDPWGGQLWPQGHYLNKLGSGPLGDATYQISRFSTLINGLGMTPIFGGKNCQIKSLSGDPDRMQHSAVSGLGMHYLPTSHKKDTRLIWVKTFLHATA